MSVLGLALLALLALLILVVAVCLAAPVAVALVGVRTDGSTRVRGEVSWLFIHKRIDAAAPRVPREKPEPARRDKRRSNRLGSALAMMRAKGFVAACRRFARRALRAVRLRELRAHGRVGLGDPADTGLAIGMLSPMLVLLSVPANSDVRLEPDFERERLEGEVALRLRLWPAVALGAAVLFLVTPATWRGLWAYRNAGRPR